jgi:hypothetical protein
MRFLFSVSLLLVFLAAGCAASSPTEEIENLSYATATASISQTTAESTATTVVEMILTKTPSAIPMLTNTSEEAIPTPSVEESKAIALNLLKTNGNCRLPCIWGLTPGITTTVERQNILASYGKFSEPDFSMSGSDPLKNPGGFGTALIQDGMRISAGLSYYETENRIETLSLVADSQQNNKYVFEDDNYSNLLEYYTLPEVLSNYGVPSEVLAFAFPRDPFLKADYEPFSLVVIYPDLGIMAEYITPTQWIGEMTELPTSGLWVGESARGCPNKSYLTLRTWNTKKNIPLKEIASIAAGEGISANAYDYFVPIEKATSMSLNDFYSTFKEPNNSQCIDVPYSRLWNP